MPEGAFKPKPRAVPEPQAPKPAGGEPVANNNDWTEDEEKFFAQGEAKNRAAEAEVARRAQLAQYEAAQAKIRQHEEGKK